MYRVASKDADGAHIFCNFYQIDPLYINRLALTSVLRHYWLGCSVAYKIHRRNVLCVWCDVKPYLVTNSVCVVLLIRLFVCICVCCRIASSVVRSSVLVVSLVFICAGLLENIILCRSGYVNHCI